MKVFWLCYTLQFKEEIFDVVRVVSFIKDVLVLFDNVTSLSFISKFSITHNTSSNPTVEDVLYEDGYNTIFKDKCQDFQFYI